MKGLKDLILLGRWTAEELDRLIHEASIIKDTGDRIDFLSIQFLGVAYKESTLIGDRNTPEVFVINLEGVDCLTFIEYVEAMRLSISFSQFTENLKRVRYQSGRVSFEMRNHFFTDWESSRDTSHIFEETHTSLRLTKEDENNPPIPPLEKGGKGGFERPFSGEKIWEVSLSGVSGAIEDVTTLIGGAGTLHVHKRLNLRRDGTSILPRIPYKDREIHYIPAGAIDEAVMEKLNTGDYAGIYSDEDGLDVSHAGIIIKTGDGIYLRHASSRSTQRKVVDEEFKGYIGKKPGLVVLRPR